uniref:Uncharacterized protein n=1 Tax=Megaselia scalaris TaxID=36166 RepID=T1GGS2_MEGSC
MELKGFIDIFKLNSLELTPAPVPKEDFKPFVYTSYYPSRCGMVDIMQYFRDTDDQNNFHNY